ncbi:hypothetical protein, partial [Pseudomonas viridiflava]|uniref:hypothetical protein n=1 Tax=Pseudomonas viridiflava TaxID=33069 RepID=UPI001980675E
VFRADNLQAVADECAGLFQETKCRIECVTGWALRSCNRGRRTELTSGAVEMHMSNVPVV